MNSGTVVVRLFERVEVSVTGTNDVVVDKIVLKIVVLKTSVMVRVETRVG